MNSATTDPMSAIPSSPVLTGKGPPVILFGHGRSGTSIVAALMRQHLGIAFGTESQFILDYHQSLSSFGSLEDDENMKRLINAILKERWFRRSNKFNDFKLSCEQIFDAIQERTYSGVLNAIFKLFAEHLGMDRWGDKTPGYIHDMQTIDGLFPDAQYVYVVRDGRDVALSLKHIHFGPKNMYTAAHDWRETVRVGDAFADSLAPERLHCIRYEDFLSDPVETFVMLAKFLNINGSQESLRDRLNHELLPTVKRGNSDKWVKAFSLSQRSAYERIAFHELQRHGYETVVDQAGQESGWLAHTYWHIMSELGKWRFKDYWKDNFYKARIRAKRILRG